MTTTLPRTGPCAPWVTNSDVLSDPSVKDETDPPLVAQMAMVASEVLYNLSAQQYTGACGGPGPNGGVVVRPVSRPTDGDTRGLIAAVPGGYTAVWGWPSSTATMNHYGNSEPPWVDLGAYPVTEVLAVKLDGVTIPPNEYYLQDYRTLIRRRPSASATPTERYGWPTSQITEMADTEVGTFSVEYKYGVPPPQTGIMAARKLAAMLLADAGGDDTVFPQRVTSVSRQGVTVSVVDVMDFFSKGLTGIYLLDLFVQAFNPHKLTKQPLAWSPDAGRPYRQPSGIS